MTRADRRLFLRMLTAVAVSFVALWLVGRAFYWLYPPSEIETKCIGKTIMELGQCMTEK